VLVEVVLFQEVQALKLSIDLVERQHGWIPGGDRFDLGVGKFLAADILGAAAGIFARHDLRVMWSIT
jgi:hypothetical protein